MPFSMVYKTSYRNSSCCFLNLSVKLTTNDADEDNREVGDDVGEDKRCFQKIVVCLGLFTTQT